MGYGLEVKVGYTRIYHGNNCDFICDSKSGSDIDYILTYCRGSEEILPLYSTLNEVIFSNGIKVVEKKIRSRNGSIKVLEAVTPFTIDVEEVKEVYRSAYATLGKVLKYIERLSGCKIYPTVDPLFPSFVPLQLNVEMRRGTGEIVNDFHKLCFLLYGTGNLERVDGRYTFTPQSKKF